MTRKIIIDTDPGVDDVIAIALAFLTPPNDTEIALITPVFGNTSLFHTVRNTVTLFNFIEQERQWREKNGYNPLRVDTPVIAIGEEGPIDGSKTIDAKHFHGKDGVGEVHTTHPHFTPENHSWDNILDNPPSHFIPSSQPAYVEILKLLKEEPENSVSIIALGPLTNVARAAEEDPNTFSKVREVIVMGGTLIIPGNVTPVGEFNIATDPEAASILFSLTSTTSDTHLSAPRLPRPLKLTLVPLDATHLHGLHENLYKSLAIPTIKAGSPLTCFLDAILQRTYRKLHSLVSQGRESEVVELHLHDPLCVYYAMLDDNARKGWIVEANADVRVECTGTWTRGMTLLDQRVRGQRPFDKKQGDSEGQVEEGEDMDGEDFEGVDDDEGGWRCGTGNRIDIVWASSIERSGNLKTVEAIGRIIWDFVSRIRPS